MTTAQASGHERQTLLVHEVKPVMQQTPKLTDSKDKKRKKDDHVDNKADLGDSQQERPQAKRRFCGLGPDSEQAKRPESPLDAQEYRQGRVRSKDYGSKGGRWTEQVLRRLISTVIKSPSPRASDIHPTASIAANTILVPNAPIDVFNSLQSLLPSIPATAAWKVDFRSLVSPWRTKAIKPSGRISGRLTITMPTRLHEAFVPFSHDMAEQLFASGFLPARYPRKTIMQSGSAERKDCFKGLVPDAGISFFNSRNTFLVLEVAYSQTEKNAQRKARDYILSSDGKIKFVVLVIVTKQSRKKGADPYQHDIPPSEHDSLSPDRDTVHVHVYKSVILPPKTLTGDHVIDGVQIFPGPAPEETLTITWADINSGTWPDFCNGAKLRIDTPQPSCRINFANLVSIARDLAGQADASRESTPFYQPEIFSHVETPLRKNGAFVHSSSPAVHLSSGGSVSTDEGRRVDPDYQPSVGSDDSSNSFGSL